MKPNVGSKSFSSGSVSAGPVFCSRCEERIPAKRLKAMPRATRCVPCQSRFDDYATPSETVMAVNGEGDGEILCEGVE